MKHLFKFLVAIMFIHISAVAIAQSGQVVTGSIVDSNGDPLIGVNVIEKENPLNGTVSDVDGNFDLRITVENATLEFSYVGYTTKELSVGSRTNFNVTLLDDTNSLEEVVVMGYGVQKKKLVTGATSQVSSEDINANGSNGTMSGIQSKMTGVTVGAANGMPGESETIIIRGVGTIGDASPLYVIDGVAGADISLLNPSDIESIDILKDAASAAIYGSRAANGVVLVTTKSGKSGHFEIRYDGYYAIQNPTNIVEVLDAQTYMDAQDERRLQSAGVGYDWESLLPSYLYDSIMDGSWTGSNWLEEMTNENAPKQSHAVTMMGGSDRYTFSAGYSYLDQEGIFGSPIEPMYKRHNARINLTNVMYKVNDLDVITVNTNMVYSYSEKSGVGSGNRYNSSLQDALTAPPIMPIYDSEGDYYDFADRQAEGWSFSDYATNPIGEMVDSYQKQTQYYNLFANAYLEIQPIKDFKIRSSYGYKFKASSYRDFEPIYCYGSESASVNDYELITQGSTFLTSWVWENTAAYNFYVDNIHHFDIVLGQSMEKSNQGAKLEATNTNLTFTPTYDYAWLSNTSGVNSSVTSVSGSPYVESMLSSVFGRLNYNYDETYMLSAMVRADGSSKFAAGNRWGYFPSVSAGWVVSNEDFLSNSSAVDFLKVRASWGQNGNCNISDFQYVASVSFPTQALYYFTDDKVSSSQGAYSTALANENVTWETSEQLDLGIDANFFNSRLSVTMDLYNKMTKDWLVQVPVLTSYGASAPYVNGGNIRNRGIELGLGWRDTVGDFRYSVSLNGTYNQNEVTYIANDEGIINGDEDVLDHTTGVLYRAQEGYPVGYFYGYQTEGIFQNDEQVANTEVKVEGSVPGDIIFSDLNGDGYITSDDRTMIGDPTPDVVMGLNISLGYKGFDFSVVANGAFGHQVIQGYRSNTQSNAAYGNYTTAVYEKRWHGEGTSNTYPSLGNISNFTKISDMLVQDADYVKIQNITLGYDLNYLWKSSPLSRFRVYVSLQNYITITGYDGFDPQVGYSGPDGWSGGIDVGNYPTSKMFVMGTNISF
ncbi:MAG: TonB-dependent receptor [Rikenellaceae bacterium]